MRILIANDDGIQAEGIRKLALALSKNHEVYVTAPSQQRSAAGHSISIHTKLRAIEQEVPGATRAWAITGTPADSVKVGLFVCKQAGIPIDVVFSGINHGGNYGYDTIYSGTVGAAMEGNFCYKPSVAVSVNDHEPKHGFDYACGLAVKVADELAAAIDAAGLEPGQAGLFGSNASAEAKAWAGKDRLLGGDFIRAGEAAFEKAVAAGVNPGMARIVTTCPSTISINVPDIDPKTIRGVKMATVGPRDYDDLVEALSDEEGTYYEYNGNVVVYAEGDCFQGEPVSPNSDVSLMQEGFATISILGYELTNFELQKEFSSSCLQGN